MHKHARTKMQSMHVHEKRLIKFTIIFLNFLISPADYHLAYDLG